MQRSMWPPEAHAVLEAQAVEEGHDGGHGGLRAVRDVRGRAREVIVDDGVGHGAGAAFVLRHVLHGELVVLAVGADFEGGAGAGHGFDFRHVADLGEHAVDVDGSVAAHAEDDHVLTVDEVLLQEFHDAAGVAALDHDADLLCP